MSDRFTVVSFQTYGDYLLKAPFLHELFAAHPNAEITVVTNPRGGQVYPLIDSRLRVVVLDKASSRWRIAGILRRLPKANVLYLVDQHPASCLFSMLIPASRRVGWYQSVSRLYHGPDLGFRDRHSVGPILSRILRLVLNKKLLRSPQGLYEGHVELGLLEAPAVYPRLAQYRTSYSFPAQPKADPPLIFCATMASWVARQLDDDRWTQIIHSLASDFPQHRIVIDAPDSLMSRLSGHPQISRLTRSADLTDFFRLISSATAVICSDSFVAHLASWFDVPAIAFFGPASPHRFAPTAPGSAVLYHQPPCSPCVQQGGSATCLAGYTQCLSLQQLRVNEVIAGTNAALPRITQIQDQHSL
jgi:ADP-heptose:LPS heptosyltransferase